MQTISPYFKSAIADERMLRAHGFDQWATNEELAEYLFDTNDRIDALCNALGLATCKDVRNRWFVERMPRQEVI